MKHILLIFLIMLIYSNAFAIVDPDGTGGLIKCANLAEEACLARPNSCWWTPLTELETASKSKCYTCSNQPQDGYSYVSGTLAKYYSVTNLAHREFMDIWADMDVSKPVFCPWIFSCPAGSYPEAAEDGYKCNTCQADTYTNYESKIMVTSDSQYWRIAANGMVATKPNTAFSCNLCGNDAVSNSEHTNCDCELGYQTADGKYTNVGTADCGEYRVYSIDLVPAYATSSGTIKRITYKMTQGYDIDGDGMHGDDIGQLIYSDELFRTKYKLSGWTPVQEADPKKFDGFLGDKLSESNNKFNIAQYCHDHPNTCTYHGTVIEMYPVWEKRSYRVVYTDNNMEIYDYDGSFVVNYGDDLRVLSIEELNKKYCELLTGGSGPDQVIDCSFSAPNGKLHAGWLCKGCGDTGVLSEGDKIPESAEEYSNNLLVLEQTYSDCPAGYYCTNNEKHECPAGSTSNSGAKGKEDCYLVGGATRFCDANKTDNCITLPSSANKIHYVSNN